jgi:hypothetical protein
MLWDKYCCSLLLSNKSMAIPWFIMASWAYYVEDDPIVTDACYDFVFKFMLTYWKDITHIHKDIVFAALGAGCTTGSGYAIKYPNKIRYAVSSLRRTV